MAFKLEVKCLNLPEFSLLDVNWINYLETVFELTKIDIADMKKINSTQSNACDSFFQIILALTK